MRALFFTAVYGWLGFTVGYFFRKWLETRWLPAYRAGQERVDWIGEDGRRIETVARSEMRRRNLLHRSTATLVFHPDGRLFVQQRALTKDVYPGLHDVCVGGTVTSGETWEENAVREVQEEMGIRGVPLYPLFDHRFQDASTNNWVRVFACVWSGRVRLQASEVAGGDWMTLDAVEALIASGAVCPDSAQGWRLYREHHGAANFARDVAPGLKALPQEN